MKLRIRFEINQLNHVFVQLNTQKDDIQLQFDTNNQTPTKPEASQLIELEVLMRPA